MSRSEAAVGINVRLVVFDWAGTIVDFGCQAPVRVLRELFDARGIELSTEDARRPMGMAKRDHIAAILAQPQMRARWKERFGELPTESVVNELYREFLPRQRELISEHADIVPGAIDVFRQLREGGITIGSTTGYTRELMDVLQPAAKTAGLSPDLLVTSDEVASGRPAPDMIYEIMRQARVGDPSEVVKVDDTVVGIEAARNAGCRSVGITASGNSMGLTEAEYSSMGEVERSQQQKPLRDEFWAAGSDFVLDTVADLPDALFSRRWR